MIIFMLHVNFPLWPLAESCNKAPHNKATDSREISCFSSTALIAFLQILQAKTQYIFTMDLPHWESRERPQKYYPQSNHA
jgi:hypothetical protein